MTPEGIDAQLDQVEASLRELASILLKLKEAGLKQEMNIHQNIRLAMIMVRFQTHLEAPDKVDEINTFMSAFQQAIVKMEEEKRED